MPSRRCGALVFAAALAATLLAHEVLLHQHLHAAALLDGPAATPLWPVGGGGGGGGGGSVPASAARSAWELGGAAHIHEPGEPSIPAAARTLDAAAAHATAVGTSDGYTNCEAQSVERVRPRTSTCMSMLQLYTRRAASAHFS